MKLSLLLRCLSIPVLFLAALAQAQPLPSLLRSVDVQSTRGARIAEPRRGLQVSRSRFVEVDQNAILAPVAGQRRVELPLFPDTRFQVDELRSYWSGDRSTFIWVGQIEGMNRGQVVLAATGDIVSANVTTDDNTFYWIRQVQGRLHSVQQVQLEDNVVDDDKLLPDEEIQPDPVPPPAANRHRSGERLATVSRDADVSVIDLMGCYTARARTAAGGVSAIQNKIQLAVAETNQAFTNSQVNAQINLVHTLEVTYDETANSISRALSDFAGTSDGQMDEVHALRNTYGADLMALFIDKVGSSGGTVGIGYLMQTNSTGFASYAFTVNEQYWSAGPGWTLAHEVGHNMGSDHNRENTTLAGAYPYSYGYQHPTSPAFRTLMAYACSPGNCPRILYFSNPLVTYSGTPTGIAAPAADSANNGLSLNNTAPTVASFRATASGCTYGLNPTSASAAAAGATGSITVSAGAGCAWTSQTSSAFLSITGGLSGSGNGTVNYSVSQNTGPARSDTIIVAGQNVTINQAAGNSCSYTLSPTSASFTSTGGTATVGVTAGTGCAWTAATATGWVTVNSGSSGSGNGTVNYTVAANTGAARNGAMTIAGQSFGISQSAGVSTVPVTIATSTAGLSITVDSVGYSSPRTFNWQPGSSHTIATSTQGTGTRYSFQSWSNGGNASQTISAPSSSATYTASFQIQYLLTTSASPLGGGSVARSPSPGDGYYNSGASVQVTANANSGFQFSNWSGSVSGGTNPVSISMNAPKTIAANFSTASNNVTIATSPPGLTIVADGVQYTAPRSFAWTAGSSHTIGALSPQQGAGARYTFANWSDSQPLSHSVTVPGGTVTYTAFFNAAYQLATAVSPSGAGSVSANPGSPDGYYAAGTAVQLTATAAAGFGFTGWSGALTGSTPSGGVTMNGPAGANANFSSVSTCDYQLGQSGISVLASGDIRELTVATGGSCAWTASPGVPWISILSGFGGSGSGTVKFNVAPNTSTASRSGGLTIGNATYTVMQSGNGCSYSLTGPGGSLSFSASQYQIGIATQSGCSWSAVSESPWIALTGATTGTGSGTLNFSVALNSGAGPRSGAIVIGGQWIPLLQKSSSNNSFFNDVPSSHIFFDYIGLLGLNNISPGCGSGAYCPDVVMTRAEMAAFIVRALYGESFSYSPAPYFTDAPSSHSHFKYIQKMRDLGITAGCTATQYCTGDPVTRGQMAVFLVRARLGIASGDNFPYPQTPYFSDIPSSHIFFPFIQKMKELGLTAGCSTTQYCSEGANTRGQMAVFVVRNFF